MIYPLGGTSCIDLSKKSGEKPFYIPFIFHDPFVFGNAVGLNLFWKHIRTFCFYCHCGLDLLHH